MRRPAKELGPRANRAITLILNATRSVFQKRGYAGTTIDEVARAAGVSRASFYTYFPTKRDALLALGLRDSSEAEALDRRLGEMTRPWTEEALRAWVDARFDLFESHAGFSFAWTQAAHEDEALRVAGMKQHLRSQRFFGMILGETDRRAAEALGLVVSSMIERSWSFCELYGDRVDIDAVRTHVTRVILALAKEREDFPVS